MDRDATVFTYLHACRVGLARTLAVVAAEFPQFPARASPCAHEMHALVNEISAISARLVAAVQQRGMLLQRWSRATQGAARRVTPTASGADPPPCIASAVC